MAAAARVLNKLSGFAHYVEMMDGWYRVIWLLVGAVWLGACSPSAAERLVSAQQELARQNYPAARSELYALLDDDPTNRAALELLGSTLLRLGDGEGARAVVQRLSAAGVAGPQLDLLEAEALLLRGQAERALEKLRQDQSIDGWRVRAAAFLMLGDEAAALAAFHAGLKQAPDIRLTSDFARFLLSIGDLSQAQAQVARLERERPWAIETLMLRGAVADALGDTAGALRIYGIAAQRFPWLAEPLLAQAQLHDFEGRLDQALELAERAQELQPGDQAISSLKLSIYAQQGNWDLIRQMLQPFERQLDPVSADGLLYAEALLRLHRPEQARALLQQAAIKAPHNRYARMMLGEAQLETGDARSALATLRPLVTGVFVYPREVELAERAALLQRDPLGLQLQKGRESGLFKQRQDVIALGLAATAARDWARALQIWQRLSSQGEDIELLRRIAESASMTGEHALARASADKALRLRPYDGELLNLAGRVRLTARADLEQATNLLAQAAAGTPHSRQFRADLARSQWLASRGEETP